ncbi:MAG: phosphate ABC transporter permease subunit PstC [Candidatus Eisenbacteria bacterium]|uniref:Phosphate transport system permease protein n=1 Tax=Eiseniibacteriota bacterium TaxID=2212470 RepID=A0A538S9A7_UNCEI|nr:MAG: phosphate ABC transporter permease subunit PstC [Candidatus Eisenbacteria bacterium]
MRAVRITADGVYRAALGGAAALVFAVVALIVYETGRGAGLSIRTFGLGFLTSTAWDPVTEKFGALPYIYGTLVSSALALLIAVPLGIGTAVYLAEIAHRRWGAIVSFVIELLAAIPSIVYGVWGFFVLAPWLRNGLEPWMIQNFGFLPFFRGAPFGIGMLNAGIVLAIMVVPTIVSISREVLLATPRSLREAALALGATRAEAIGVAVDAARPGILGAVILALGRALGETMAVTMVIGNTNRISLSLLDPGATMSSIIANEFTEATSPLYVSALIEIALVLFAVTIVVNGLARLLVLWATGGRRAVAAAA